LSKKLAITVLTIIVLLVLMFGLWVRYITKPGTDEVYLIPEGHTGCVFVLYDIKDALPLKIKNKVITYQIPKDGVLKTSSNETFGWARKSGSGWHDVKYYYVNENGARVKELGEKNIHNPGNAGTTLEDTGGKIIRVAYSYFFVGSEKDAQDPFQACSNFAMQEKLLNTYYKKVYE
jgi:hypothetical protein